MRIISGKFRGKRLNAPTNLPVRPTTDFAKEALFNILNNHFDFGQIKALDLFAGTGNISYELASRGCQLITAVDVHQGCISFISKTAKELNLPISALKRDVMIFLQRPTMKYDFIFADPPYDFENKQTVIESILGSNWLAEDGLLILEHGSSDDFEDFPGFLELRKYGSVHFSLFEKTSES